MFLFVGPYSESKRIGGNVTRTVAIKDVKSGSRVCIFFWTTSLISSRIWEILVRPWPYRPYRFHLVVLAISNIINFGIAPTKAYYHVPGESKRYYC